MLISVIYQDGKHDMVKDFILNRLIEEKQITKFKRSDGWIDIKSDRLRGSGKPHRYAGPERRSSIIEMEKLTDLH